MLVYLVLGRRRLVFMLVLCFMGAPLHFFLVLRSCMVQSVSLVDELLSALWTLDNVAVMLMAGMAYEVLVF